MFTLFQQRERIDHLAFSPGGLMLAAAVVPSRSPVSRVRIWDLVERQSVDYLDPDGGVADMLFLRDDATLVIQRVPEDQLYFLDIPTGETRPLFESVEDGVPFCAVLGKDGESVLAAFHSEVQYGYALDIRQMDLSTWQERPCVEYSLAEAVAAVALRPGRPILAAVHLQPAHIPRIMVLTRPGQMPAEIDLPRGTGVTSMEFSPDGRTLALRTARSVWLWNVDTRAIVARVTVPTNIEALAFSPDSSLIATGLRNGVVSLYDSAAAQQRTSYDWQIGPVQSLAFAPDGMTAAAGGNKGTIVVWDVE